MSKTRNTTTLLLSLIAIVTSCHEKTFNEQKYADCPNHVFITEEDLPPVQKLEWEKIDLPEDICMASEYSVYKDSILIVSHQHPDPYFISVLRMGTWEAIGQYCKRGKGPDELINFNRGTLSDNYFVGDDIATGRFVFLNMDSVLKYGQNYSPKIVSGAEGKLVFTWISALNDSTFICSNKTYFDDDKDMKTKSASMFTCINDRGEYQKDTRLQDSLFVFNVAHGHCAIRQRDGRFICGYTESPLLRVCNSNFEVLKTIVGPEDSNTEYIQFINGAGSNEINLANTKNQFWSSFCVDKESVFFLNFRRHNADDEDVYMYSKTAEIFRLDFDGNILARYQSYGNPFITLSFCETSNTLYITSWNEDEENTLYRAKLN